MADPIALGLRALKGGAAVVGVRIENDEPKVILSTFLATSTQGDRLSREPYGVAAEMPRDPDGKPSAAAANAVVEGRRRQDALAAESLQAILRIVVEAGHAPVVAALLVNRAGWVTDLLDYSIGWPEHVPVAEGLAVREALRFAAGRNGIEMVELDEKSLPDLAAAAFGGVAIDARLKSLGAAAGKPWLKEQKLACLAAWFALSTAPGLGDA